MLNQIESLVYRGRRNLNLAAALCQIYSHFSSGNWLSPEALAMGKGKPILLPAGQSMTL